MFTAGDRVIYAGNMAEVRGMRGVVEGPGTREGRVTVEFPSLGVVLDMSDTVLENDAPEGTEMGKRTTTVTHPDGTLSTRTSKTMAYSHAVESKLDMRALAATKREEAEAERAELGRFVEAVKGGRVLTEASGSVYVVGEGGWRVWIGHHTEADPLDRKAGVRWVLARHKERAAKLDAEAEQAETGPAYTYGVYRWSNSEALAAKGLREFDGKVRHTTFRVVAVDA